MKHQTDKARWMKVFRAPGGSAFIYAAILLALYFILNLAGFRTHTSILSGTPPQSSLDITTSAYLGLLYLMAHMAAVLVAPVLLIAGLLARGLSLIRN